jgi:hypothetical protein
VFVFTKTGDVSCKVACQLRNHDSPRKTAKRPYFIVIQRFVFSKARAEPGWSGPPKPPETVKMRAQRATFQ